MYSVCFNISIWDDPNFFSIKLKASVITNIFYSYLIILSWWAIILAFGLNLRALSFATWNVWSLATKLHQMIALGTSQCDSPIQRTLTLSGCTHIHEIESIPGVDILTKMIQDTVKILTNKTSSVRTPRSVRRGWVELRNLIDWCINWEYFLQKHNNYHRYKKKNIITLNYVIEIEY